MSRPPIAEVIARHDDALLAMPNVVGVYEGARPDGAPVIRVMLARRDAATARRVPRALEGWPVEVEVSGEIRAMPDSSE
uniref:Uncharacterized protein n=1 Tax=Eiseniibacteriota bacterium TaxID=2212470 RepID=A0A832I2Z7_UNCEI